MKITLRPTNARIPWQEKLASDIQYDNELRKDVRPPEGLNGRSKYFNDVRSYISEKKAEAHKNSTQVRRKKLVNSRITEYFSLRHPGIKVRRSATKITFQVMKGKSSKEKKYRTRVFLQPQNNSRLTNCGALNRQRDLFSIKQLESFDVMKLQKWMKEYGIPFDPCDSQQGLIQKVKKSLSL